MIDTKESGSPGWWMQRLSEVLVRDQRRFAAIEAYYRGEPPLAWGSQDVSRQFWRFQQMSRTNFAEPVIEALVERVRLRGVASEVDHDVDGDVVAWRLMRANGLHGPQLKRLARLSRRFGRAYLATAAPLTDGGPAVITVEDPREMVAEPDPFQHGKVRAALKLFYDAQARLDVAILWLPGKMWVATRPHTGPVRRYRSKGILGVTEPVRVSFVANAFTMAPDWQDGMEPGYYSQDYTDADLPVDIVENRDGVGDFETHTDLLDRIHHMIMQRIVTATLQAFRQRGIKQSTDSTVDPLPEHDEEGKKIDYQDVFESGPDGLWLLPPGAEIWESAQVDLQGILQSAKDDMLQLSMVTGTPMSMFTPDAATQSAEGANLQRERLLFRVEDFQDVAGDAIARALARAFRYMGDDGRSDPTTLTLSWAPAQRHTLAEMGSAAAQVGQTLSWEQTQAIVWQRTPGEIAVARAQRMEDMVLVNQVAGIQAAAAGTGAAGDGPAGRTAPATAGG